jgi:hypothetical protein
VPGAVLPHSPGPENPVSRLRELDNVLPAAPPAELAMHQRPVMPIGIGRVAQIVIHDIREQSRVLRCHAHPSKQIAAARHQEMREDILAMTTAARDALQEINKQLASQPTETAAAIRPQIDQLDSLLQQVTNDTEVAKTDSDTLERAKKSAAEIKSSITKINSLLKTRSDAVGPRSPAQSAAPQLIASDIPSARWYRTPTAISTAQRRAGTVRLRCCLGDHALSHFSGVGQGDTYKPK